MARRRGRTTPGRTKGRGREPTTYYSEPKSDADFVKQSRRRVARTGRRRLLIRVAMVLVLAAAIWLLGPPLARMVKSALGQQMDEFREAGEHLREGRDRRSGVGWEEEGR